MGLRGRGGVGRRLRYLNRRSLPRCLPAGAGRKRRSCATGARTPSCLPRATPLKAPTFRRHEEAGAGRNAVPHARRHLARQLARRPARQAQEQAEVVCAGQAAAHQGGGRGEAPEVNALWAGGGRGRGRARGQSGLGKARVEGRPGAGVRLCFWSTQHDTQVAGGGGRGEAACPKQ